MATSCYGNSASRSKTVPSPAKITEVRDEIFLTEPPLGKLINPRIIWAFRAAERSLQNDNPPCAESCSSFKEQNGKDYKETQHEEQRAVQKDTV